MKKPLTVILGLLITFTASAQWTPYAMQLLQQPNAKSARWYLNVTNVEAGSNITFVYNPITANWKINSTGGGGGGGGTNGVNGTNATITIGTTYTLAPGSSAGVTNVGTSLAAIFNFGIPAGATGAAGATGPAGANGTNGVNGTNGLNGINGTNGVDGLNATVAAGTTTTLPAGSSATVVNVGTSQNAIFDFGIPKGADGTNGGGGGGAVAGVDYSLANVSPYSGGTNFYIDFSLPAQVWSATNYALRYSSNWPSGSTSRIVNILIPPTNFFRRIYVYDDATNWLTAGMNSQYTLLAGNGALIRGDIFTQGETNVTVTLIGSKSVASYGETFFNPTSIPGCVLWLDSGVGLWKDVAGTVPVTASNDVIQRWNDQSGNGNDLTNGISTSKWSEFGANNALPCVQFLGSSSLTYFRSVTSVAYSIPSYAFIVYNRTTTNSQVVLLDSKAATSTVQLLVNAAGVWSLSAGTIRSFGTMLSFNWQLITAKINSLNSSVTTNGVSAFSGLDIGANSLTGFTIGNRSSLSSALNGNISEVIIYAAPLTTQNVTDIELYLTTKYGPLGP